MDYLQISAEYLGLQPAYQEVIADVCEKMGDGMTVYLDRAPGSLRQWDEVESKGSLQVTLC